MEIEVYQNSFMNKNINFLKYFFVVLVFIFLLILILVFNNNFYDYYDGVCYIEKENEIITLIDLKELNKIIKNDEIIIERTTFSYNVLSISSDNFEYGNNIFKKVVLYINLPKWLNITNNSFNYKIITGKDTILNYVLKSIKGG